MPIAEIKGKTALFLHIPKTGGTSIERHLESIGCLTLKGGNHRKEGINCSSQHLHAEAIRQLFPEKNFDWAFMVVRHPVERIVSQYKYQLSKAYWPRSRWPFHLWLRYVLFRRNLDPYYRDNHFRPQIEFEGYLAEVFRFEDGIDHCIRSVDEKFGIVSTEQAAWEKRSSKTNVTITKDDIALIHDIYRKDFERYGYK